MKQRQRHQQQYPMMILQRNDDDQPWNVDVCTAMPQQIRMLPHFRGRYVTAAVIDRWYCLCLLRKSAAGDDGDGVVVDHYELKIWYAAVSSSLEHLKYHTPVLTLHHDLLKGHDDHDNDDTTVPLLAAAVSPTTSNIVYIYAVVKNILLLWKISRKDVVAFHHQQQQQQHESPKQSSRMKPAAIVTLPEHISALTVEWNDAASPMILIGGRSGKMYWVTQMHVPVGLNVAPVEPNAGGVLSRLWNAVQYHEHNVPVAALLYLTNDAFVSISATGRLVVWNVTPTEGAKTLFGITSDHSVVDLLRESQYLLDIGVQSLQVLKAAAAVSQNNNSGGDLYFICLTQHLDEDARLYWVHVQLPSVSSSSTTPEIQSAVWLNRFVSPESVEITGLVLTNDGLAYAAFSQDASLPGILMALEKDSQTPHEVDLPMPAVQNLLENTMAKDVVTHGVTVLDESGLGLRARLVVPPQAARVATGSRRTTAAVPNLTNHLT